MEEDISVRHLIGERKPNPLLSDFNVLFELIDLDIGNDFVNSEKIYSCSLLYEVRTTFYLTRSAYETLKKHIFKSIYQLSKTITNIDENQDDYCEKIWDVIEEHELFFIECMRNPNLYSIPFVYGIELLFRKFNYEYKIPSGDLTPENFDKFKNILLKIRLFLKPIINKKSYSSLGNGLIFRTCISIIENLNVHYATGGEPKHNTIIRHSEVLSVFEIEIIKRNRGKKRKTTGFESKEELKIIKRLKKRINSKLL